MSNESLTATKKDGTKDIIAMLKQMDSKKYYSILALAVTGAALLIFGNFFASDSDTSAPIENNVYNLEEISREYEEELTHLIEQVSGAGKTSVMVTMESGSETIYAKAETSDERFSSDESSGDDIFSYSSEYVIIEGENGSKTALVEKENEPAVQGVAVLCEGGGDLHIISQVTELVCVVMGVSSNRVYVGEITSS